MHYMTVLVIEYESTAYQQYKMAKKKLGVFFQFFAREATLMEFSFPKSCVCCVELTFIWESWGPIVRGERIMETLSPGSPLNT